MFKRNIRRVVNTAALTTLLAVASPIAAQATGWTGWSGPETLLERVWNWLASLEEISGRVERGEPSGVQEKTGGAIGLDGGALDGEGVSGDPTCTMNEAGICIDPNG